MNPIGISAENGKLPVFPTTYAQAVIDHAKHKKTRGRGRNPSMAFLEERNPRKALRAAHAVMASPDGVIRDRLRHLSKYMPGQEWMIYAFAEYVAEHVNAALVPQGFVLTAALALHDLEAGVDGFTNKPIKGFLVNQSPLIYGIIEMNLPAIAGAIFPRDFAGAVKETMDNVHQIQKEKRARAKAAAPRPTINGDPLVIYTAMRRVADLAYQFYTADAGGRGYWLDDRRNESVNAFYNQTTGGLFLEQYYGIPGSIWTPWGKWGCWGSGGGCGDQTLKAFMAAIGDVVEFEPIRHTKMGSVGPIYAILRVGDIELPKPELREHASYFEYEEANRLWAEVAATYKSRN